VDRVCSSNSGYPGRFPRTFHQTATGGGMMRAKKSEYRNYYENQGARFQELARYLGHCHVIITIFSDKFDYNFPPDEEEQQTFEEFVREHYNAKGGIEFEEIDYDSIFDFLENGMMQIKNRDIRNLESFKKMELYCIYLFLIYLTIAQIKSIKVKKPAIAKLASLNTISVLNDLDFLLCSKANQLIGYWTAKMEEKRKNIKNVSVKTQKKIENEEIIREILVEHKFEINIDIIAKAMRKIDRGERTVKNAIKKILDKKGK
jgi:hypothetical protein